MLRNRRIHDATGGSTTRALLDCAQPDVFRDFPGVGPRLSQLRRDAIHHRAVRHLSVFPGHGLGGASITSTEERSAVHPAMSSFEALDSRWRFRRRVKPRRWPSVGKPTHEIRCRAQWPPRDSAASIEGRRMSARKHTAAAFSADQDRRWQRHGGLGESIRHEQRRIRVPRSTVCRTQSNFGQA